MTDLVDTLRARITLNAEPEEGEDDAANDAEVAEPESERRAVQDRECDVKPCTGRSVQDNNERDDDVPNRNCGKSLSPTTKFCQRRGITTLSRTTYHERPIASILDASSQTATLVASEIQYAMKL